MSEGYWYVLGVNPQPWVVPPFSPGRKDGKLFMRAGRDEGLHAYQEAVRDELRLKNPVMLKPPYYLKFWFWREVPAYTTPRQVEQRKHDADVTNCQKALEDALQGILIDNDKDVTKIQSEMVEQGPDVQPRIVILASSITTPTLLSQFPPSVVRDIMATSEQPQRAADYNEWRGPGS